MARKIKVKSRGRWGDGGIRQLGPNKWEVRASAGYNAEGQRIRPSRTVIGTRDDAKAVLQQLQRDLRDDNYVEPHNMTLKEWLDIWLDECVKPPSKAQRTYERYQEVVKHIISELGEKVLLQKLRASQARRYFDSCDERLDRSTVALHYTVLNGALNVAVEDGILRANPLQSLRRRPKRKDYSTDLEAQNEVVENCWEAWEAKKFLDTAARFGPQWAAFFRLALDTGMRKSELCGLQWRDIDWKNGTVAVRQQLVRSGKGEDPAFRVTKGRQARLLHLAPLTLEALRVHRKHQAELKLAAGPHYRDWGMVFAKEPEPKVRNVGYPLQANNLGERVFATIVKAAGVKRIKFHGLRHTCATLLLTIRVPPNYVAKRLGHKDELTTIRIYGHALPTGDKDFAQELETIIGMADIPKPQQQL